ncbi:MAG: DUF6531 domain-containing protein [Acidimicrobiales bacterium]|jgi:YD repeat-containing protein|nr:DUF6531 domain-containing protein [Acidimicrobiales bacterium]
MVIVVLVPGVVVIGSGMTPRVAAAQAAPPVTIPGSQDPSAPPKLCSGGALGGPQKSSRFGSVYLPSGTTTLTTTGVNTLFTTARQFIDNDVFLSRFDQPVGGGRKLLDHDVLYPTSQSSTRVQITVATVPSSAFPVAGWYRLDVVDTSTHDGSWTVTVAGGGGACSPSVVERTQSCNEASPGLGDGSAGVGKPVSTATGAEVMSAVDLEVPSRGGQLSVGRCYNSLLSGSSGSLGPGWSWNWSSRVQVDAPSAGEVTVWQPGGAPVVFSPAPNGSGGVAGYVAGPWVSATLVRESSSVWAFTLLDGTRYRYATAGPVPGRLVSITNRLGYVTSLTYNSSTQRLETIRDDDSQRTLTVGWNPAGDRVASVTDGANRATVDLHL